MTIERIGVADEEPSPSIGLAAFAGALAGEWDTVDEDMAEIVAARQQVSDRPAPDLTDAPGRLARL